MSLFSAVVETSTLGGTAHRAVADSEVIWRQLGPLVYSIFAALSFSVSAESGVEELYVV